MNILNGNGCSHLILKKKKHVQLLVTKVKKIKFNIYSWNIMKKNLLIMFLYIKILKYMKKSFGICFLKGFNLILRTPVYFHSMYQVYVY